MKVSVYIVFAVLLVHAGNLFAQTGKRIVIPADSTTSTKNPAFTKDTGIQVVKGDTIKTVPKHDPGKATLRSLIIPGWGQAYNREYWKIPIVYGALGTVAGFYIYNNTWYKRTRDAFNIRVNNDSAHFKSIHPKLQPLSAQSLQIYRNAFRRDRDYSALYFIITWGLNIVDATVFGHLKDFNVSEDLSLKIHPIIRVNGNTGVSLVLGFKSPSKSLPATF
ncbi:DUF5683 domain-containing protein [Segetibacter koreensis]|uniref:DUF5683 domain-containing protein n=1 Tax=Segetibacter koreensis TaxID=398037 RepID=UPI00037FA8AF|nr:DUF5683 domain-containing protein [Segetibacter koreensis]